MADSDLPEPGSRAEGRKEPEGVGAGPSASLPWPLLPGRVGCRGKGRPGGLSVKGVNISSACR